MFLDAIIFCLLCKVTLDKPGVPKISIPKGRAKGGLFWEYLTPKVSKGVTQCEAPQEILFYFILISLFSWDNPGKSEK
jgi:hypothetical protein